jgi:hypothetical protein
MDSQIIPLIDGKSPQAMTHNSRRLATSPRKPLPGFLSDIAIWSNLVQKHPRSITG